MVMAGLTTHVLRERLEALHDDLANSDSSERCSVSVVRVFNALVAEVREHLSDDPVVKVIAPIWPIDDESKLPSISSLQVLAGQLRAALGPRPSRVSASPSAASAAA
jgi:hypothetical protein